jgi:hypothetical protein
MGLRSRFLMDFPLPLPSCCRDLWEAEVRKAPSLIKRHAGRSVHQGPVLTVLAMLAATKRLRVAPRGCALPLTAAATNAL